MPVSIFFYRCKLIIRNFSDKYSLPIRGNISQKKFIKLLDVESIDSLWQKLSKDIFPLETDSFCENKFILYKRIFPNTQINKITKLILNYKIDVLGSGLKSLGNNIDWHTDIKTGKKWEPEYYANIEYNNLEESSDVKVPWEISRMQWLIPLGQNYVINKNEKHALFVKNIILDWIKKNEYGFSVNWTCTMEVALRAINWIWFFHVFKNSIIWEDRNFRFIFLRSLYLHIEFIENHLEISNVNGNHLTADACGLFFGGLFFKLNKKPNRWIRKGKSLLEKEIINQVFLDGVCFEGSLPYHRLVTELFFYALIYGEAKNFLFSRTYKRKLNLMAEFILFYSKPNGLSPVIGDNDNARVLPLGNQELNNHKYLYFCIKYFLKKEVFNNPGNDELSELLWIFDLNTINSSQIKSSFKEDKSLNSKAFNDSGYYVMRHNKNFVFIDCSEVGYKGRGGHGHNDCLSFEASLAGENLIRDCGSYLYTASYSERNKFRSTAFHNTVQINKKEINRFISDYHLWTLNYDAKPKCISWEDNNDRILFLGKHKGYERLKGNIKVKRKILLYKKSIDLIIHDFINGGGINLIEIPLHFEPGIDLKFLNKEKIQIKTKKNIFFVTWESNKNFCLDIIDCRISSSYGEFAYSKKLKWKYQGNLPCDLKIKISHFKHLNK